MSYEFLMKSSDPQQAINNQKHISKAEGGKRGKRLGPATCFIILSTLQKKQRTKQRKKNKNKETNK